MARDKIQESPSSYSVPYHFNQHNQVCIIIREVKLHTNKVLICHKCKDHQVDHYGRHSTEDLLLLATATATVKRVKRCLTITELVVVWSVCSVCTSMTKSKPVGPHIQLDTLQRFFALAVGKTLSLIHI